MIYSFLIEGEKWKLTKIIFSFMLIYRQLIHNLSDALPVAAAGRWPLSVAGLGRHGLQRGKATLQTAVQPPQNKVAQRRKAVFQS